MPASLFSKEQPKSADSLIFPQNNMHEKVSASNTSISKSFVLNIIPTFLFYHLYFKFLHTFIIQKDEPAFFRCESMITRNPSSEVSRCRTEAKAQHMFRLHRNPLTAPTMNCLRSVIRTADRGFGQRFTKPRGSAERDPPCLSLNPHLCRQLFRIWICSIPPDILSEALCPPCLPFRFD